MTTRNLFLFAHQDDEIGIMPFIDMMTPNEKAHAQFLYLTDGGPKSELRDKESTRVLAKLGIPASQVEFLGGTEGISDGKAPEEIIKIYEVLTKRLDKLGSSDLYIPAWEGGHQDHDALHAAGVLAAHRNKNEFRITAYPLYNSNGLPSVLFNFGLPPLNCTTNDRVEFPFLSGLRYLFLTTLYRTQFGSLIFLAPLIAYNFVIRRSIHLGVVGTIDHLSEKPHKGALLYEKRKKYTWSELSLHLANLKATKGIGL